MKIGYSRVSTKEQNLDMQIFALEDAGCEKIYEEVTSGSKADRPVLNNVLKQLREGDILVIWKLDRLGRSLKHLVELVHTLMQRNIGLCSLNDPIDTTTPQGRLTFNIFASLAEFERDIIRGRTQAALALPVHADVLAVDRGDSLRQQRQRLVQQKLYIAKGSFLLCKFLKN